MDSSDYLKWPVDARNKLDEMQRKMTGDLMESIESYRKMYIQTLVFMNGGASVAILSAHATMSKEGETSAWIFWPLVSFVIGLILTVRLIDNLHTRFSTRIQDSFSFYKALTHGEINFDTFMKKTSESQDNTQPNKWENFLWRGGLYFFIIGFIVAIPRLFLG